MKKSPEIQRSSRGHQGQSRVQTKLKIGQPGDKHEQQADAVADQVMKMPDDEEKVSRMPVSEAGSGVMMSPEEDESVQMSPEEEESVQMSPEEEESVQMSEEEESVQMSEEEESVQMSEDEESMQMSEEEESVQMSEEEEVQTKEEEEVSMKPMIQRSGDGQAVASPGLVNNINSSKGGGRNLPDNVNEEMSRKIGSDFSNVRVHTDSRAHKMNEGLGAKAFAHGNDIYFNKGQYDPGKREGKHLLAHELTHVVQQKGKKTELNRKWIKDNGWRYPLPKGVNKSVMEIQGVVGTLPDGIYGPNTKDRVKEYQKVLIAKGLYKGKTTGKWNLATDAAHDLFALRSPGKDDYNCAGFAFKNFRYVGLDETKRIYSGMTKLSGPNDRCAPFNYKFWMWEVMIKVVDTRTGKVVKSPWRDFHTVGGQTDKKGRGPAKVMSKDGKRPVTGPKAPMDWAFVDELVILSDGSRHSYLKWVIVSSDLTNYCSPDLPK